MNGRDFLTRPGARPFLSLVSLALLAGWFTAFVNLYLSYAPLDGEPGLGLRDIEYHFHGNRNTNRFASMINGPMAENFFDPNDIPWMTEWALAPGRPDFDPEAHRRVFEERVLPVLEDDCQLCHVEGGKADFAPLTSYEEVEHLLQVDTGPDTAALARFSHFHLIGMGLLAALTGLLALVFLPMPAAGILSCLPAAGLLLDVGGWWLTRETARAAPLVILGGGLFAAGIVGTHLLLQARLWGPGSRR